MVEIQLKGAPAQIGLARGRQLKYAIQLASEHWGPGHTHQYSRKEAHAYGRRMARDMAQRCPQLMEEILATGKGAEMSEDDICAYAFRCWNALSDHPATLACYNFAAHDSKRGPVIAGVLEDSPPFYLLETVRPKSGHAFYGVTWAGMAWAGRCINEKGLAMGQASSFAGTRFAPGAHKFPFDLYARVFYAQRWAIQNAATVDEAIDIIRGFECASVIMLADRSGKVVILETCGKLHAVRAPDELGVLTGGVFLAPELIKALIDQGVAHDWECGVRANQRVSVHLRKAKGKTTMEWMAKYLQTEREDGGWCHDGMQSATIACPSTGEFWVSGYRPCACGFRKFRVKDL
ncbi:MAG: hypothetical protein HY360_17960 [Verrucomicrobia bacterium]|nr:hypothetical protein [Verrucomicrobiota bacterium]